MSETQNQNSKMELEPRTVIAIAEACHEANRALCQSMGDNSQVPWAEAEIWQKDSAVVGVEGIISGEINTPEDSHRSWLRVKEADGWVYGENKDAEKKTHPCMVPYGDLPAAQQAKDAVFFCVVRMAMTVYRHGQEDC